MASLEWKKLNSNVEVKDTKKKLYGKYFCSAKYFCPGGRITLSHENDCIEKIYDALELRKETQRMYNYGGSWLRQKEKIDQIDVHQLLAFKNVMVRYKHVVKYRVEEPYITFYTTSEEELHNLASTDLVKWKDYLKTVNVPADQHAIDVLDQGAIFFKTDIGYKYKFVCKDGTCANKSSIYSYLDNLADDVKVSRTVWTMLERPGSFIWNVWFYANDPNIANMLNIIEPNFITNIHEVVVA